VQSSLPFGVSASMRVRVPDAAMGAEFSGAVALPVGQQARNHRPGANCGTATDRDVMAVQVSAREPEARTPVPLHCTPGDFEKAPIAFAAGQGALPAQDALEERHDARGHRAG